MKSHIMQHGGAIQCTLSEENRLEVNLDNSPKVNIFLIWQFEKFTPPLSGCRTDKQ